MWKMRKTFSVQMKYETFNVKNYMSVSFEHDFRLSMTRLRYAKKPLYGSLEALRMLPPLLLNYGRLSRAMTAASMNAPFCLTLELSITCKCATPYFLWFQSSTKKLAVLIMASWLHGTSLKSFWPSLLNPEVRRTSRRFEDCLLSKSTSAPTVPCTDYWKAALLQHEAT